ncbi:hypothetical protein PG984_012797 [Apiospora sp. TS-2023a]
MPYPVYWFEACGILQYRLCIFHGSNGGFSGGFNGGLKSGLKGGGKADSSAGSSTGFNGTRAHVFVAWWRRINETRVCAFGRGKWLSGNVFRERVRSRSIAPSLLVDWCALEKLRKPS